MRKLILFALVSMLGAASARACPNIKGDDFVCEGDIPHRFAGMELKDGILLFQGEALPLNGQVYTDPDGSTSSGTCQGNTITQRGSFNDLRAEHTISLVGNELHIIGTELVILCESDQVDCVKPGTLPNYQVASINITCRRK